MTTDIRTVTVHEVTSPRLRVRARPVDAPATTGRELYFHGPAEVAALLEGRRLMLAPPGGEATEVVAMTVDLDAPAVAGMADLHRVTLAADVVYRGHPQEPDDAATVVLGNLVDADQGKSAPEAVLGSGDGRSAFQTFKLPQAPLTYHQAPAQTPPRAPELEVAVAGRTWTRVESLFGQAADAEVYIVREDADGNSWVQFGDGARFGARLPSGVENVTARIRTGVGAHGALKPETSVQAGRLDRLDAVQLPGVVSGGAEPEEPDVARSAAPGRIRSLDRLVGLTDFESEALAIPGVALASAVWGLVGGVPTVTVTVLMEGGREQEHAAVAESLRTAARERGPDRFEIDVLQGSFLDVRLHAEVAVEPGLDPETVLAAVIAALGVETPGARRPADGLFSLRRRRFGENETAARATGVIQNTPGVAWTTVDPVRDRQAAPEGARPAAQVPAGPGAAARRRGVRLPAHRGRPGSGGRVMAVTVPLYDRLPELYRIEDARDGRHEPLRALLALVEESFGAVHESIEALYHDLFIETCEPWAIPYIADLLGTSHLSGDTQTLRRDVALTIHARRRKGTLGAIEDITEALTGWGVHAAELFKDVVCRAGARPPAAGRRRAAAVRADHGRSPHRRPRRHRGGPRPGDAGADRHPVRPVRAHARLPHPARRRGADEPAEPGGVPVAAAAVPDRPGGTRVPRRRRGRAGGRRRRPARALRPQPGRRARAPLQPRRRLRRGAGRQRPRPRAGADPPGAAGLPAAAAAHRPRAAGRAGGRRPVARHRQRRLEPVGRSGLDRARRADRRRADGRRVRPSRRVRGGRVVRPGRRRAARRSPTSRSSCTCPTRRSARSRRPTGAGAARA